MDEFLPASDADPSVASAQDLGKTRVVSGPISERSSWGEYYLRQLGHYYRLLIPEGASVLEIGCGDGALLAELPNRKRYGVELDRRQIELAKARLPDGQFWIQDAEAIDLGGTTFDYIILSETINYLSDVEEVFRRIHFLSKPGTRLLLNFHNNLWLPVLNLATKLGLRRRGPVSSWFSSSDVMSLLDLSNWEVITTQGRILLPCSLVGLAPLIDRCLAPLFSWSCLSIFVVARSKALTPPKALSVSVVVPARNEAGNIESAITRTPRMGEWTEFIFVEGGSKDNTWEEILRIKEKYPDQIIKTIKQTGSGKGNAVRDGFAIAEGEIFMILDADLTMPPEELPKFYRALAEGRCEFANGSRLVYPMEKKAMQFLNLCANKTFGLLFSWMLGQPVKDTLCGTKVLSRQHYQRIVDNRAYFGDFDPFGDFDLLFGAGKLNLRIRDIPIRYRDRTYGSTNIQRWKHGVLLLRMVVFAARKIKFV